MRFLKLTSVMLSLAITFCLLSIETLAYVDKPDINALNSLTIELQLSLNNETKVESNAEIAIYKVANLLEKEGQCYFEYTDDFIWCSYNLNEPVSTESIKSMSDEVIKKSIDGMTAITDENGKTYYNELTSGIYLVRQSKVTDGFIAFEPFLVYLPSYEDSGWSYNIVAKPKINLIGNVTITPTATPTITPTVSSDKHIPKTGDNIGYVKYTMLGSFILFIVSAILMKKSRKQEQN